jgi:hypothetical protein
LLHCTSDRINVPIQGAGEPYDGRKVSFDRIVGPARKRVRFTAAQDALEAHGEAPHRCEGRRTRLECLDFSRLFQDDFSSWLDAERGRDNRGYRVPRCRFPDRFKDLVLVDETVWFLFFGSAPSGQEPLQIDRLPS